MSEETTTQTPHKSWLEKLSQALSGEPKNILDLLEILRDASERQLIDANALHMIESILEISKFKVRDIMTPRAQMTVIEKDTPLNAIIPIVLQTVHSRFPVIGENKDEVLGILLAKDLLGFLAKPDRTDKTSFHIQDLLRPAVFVPESKRIDVLLHEFRVNRNHMAVVVDEYGGVTGLVTIEDILEEIVGNIEDEYDTENDQLIRPYQQDTFLVKALAPIEDFNEHFNTDFDDSEVDTIGGLVTRQFGHLPKRGESVSIQDFTFKVLRADSRRVYLLQVTPPLEKKDGE